ncbi:MAG TPA: Uma2 family endonuclease [Ilumatobacteraceae bacterium]|nr:Uma2 family endonuclease [Ilumatobacteraceae bacterium]HRB04147.1 Uma2 family endonuclease [Ilumatobacteraceae bacterium]
MPVPIDADDEAPEYDYPHLPGEELDPLMESTVHSAWCHLLVTSARHTLAATDAVVCGNTPFVPAGQKYHTAPDLLVVPGMRGHDFGRYVVDEHGHVPSVCVEVVSPSNTWPRLERRYRRWLEAGVPEVYALHPLQQSVDRIELVDDRIVHRDAIGVYSEGMQMTFTMIGDRLGLCCPGGRAVTLEDDPLAWMVLERQRGDAERDRADAERERADAERERADAAEARSAALEVELRRRGGN